MQRNKVKCQRKRLHKLQEQYYLLPLSDLSSHRLTFTQRVQNMAGDTVMKPKHLDLPFSISVGRLIKQSQKLFCLPSKSSLLKWVSKLPNCAGLTQPAVEVISTKVRTMDAEGKLCIISFDEISLESNLAYQSNTDELIGLLW